jgi:hypothetical protein
MDGFTWFVIGVAGGAGAALALGYAGLAWYLNRNNPM